MSLYNDVLKNQQDVMEVAASLDRLAVAFDRVGNALVANELFGHAQSLNVLATKTVQVVEKYFADAVQRDQEAYANMVKAVMRKGDEGDG